MFVYPIAKIGIAAGVVAGAATVVFLNSDEGKKVCTKITAAAIRAKDAVKDAFVGVADGAREIIDDAMDYNAERAAAKEDAAVAEAWEEDAESTISDEDTEDASDEDAPEDDTTEE